MAKKFFLLGIIVMTISSCLTSKNRIEKTIFINATTKPCTNEALQTECLQVKWTKEQQDWEIFYETIEGFSPESGNEYELIIQEEKIENPPADVSNIRYELVKIITTAASEIKIDDHTSQHSLDWKGTYEGVLPCADCEGIQTQITIDVDKNYTRKVTYLKDGNKDTYEEQGLFAWNKQGTKIILKSTSENKYYQVGENYIRALDMNGNIITGALAEKYVLQKITKTNSIEDKKWRLISFMGKKINEASEEFFILFNSQEKRMQTKVGCNRMSGNYVLDIDKKELTIKQIMSTMMACEEAIIQDFKYAEQLEKITHFSIDGQKLVQKIDAEIVAEYELVE